MMKMAHIKIPEEFNRNHPKFHHVRVEQSGSHLIRLVSRKTGMVDLSDKDILDMGCGSRFTQTIINRDIAIKSYTGIDVDQRLINYLADNVRDSRFSFYYWNMHNDAYNPKGEKLTKNMKLPSPEGKKFDAVWMFSVVTHLTPVDAKNLFYVLRNYVKPNGRLFFSTLIDNAIEYHENRLPISETHPDWHAANDSLKISGVRSFVKFVLRFLTGKKGGEAKPLGLKVSYNENVLRKILADTGWQVDSFHKPANFVTYHFVCSPNPDFSA